MEIIVDVADDTSASAPFESVTLSEKFANAVAPQNNVAIAPRYAREIVEKRKEKKRKRVKEKKKKTFACKSQQQCKLIRRSRFPRV